MNTIQAQWDSYLQEVIPADAPAIQIQESRRAFYSGAQAMLSINYNIGGDEISEDAGCAILTGVEQELGQFVRMVQQGKA